MISRGNERRAIVRDDADRRERLRRTVEMYGWRLHAFVLRTNHDHLFVEAREANLSAGMQHYDGSDTGPRRRGGRFDGSSEARPNCTGWSAA